MKKNLLLIVCMISCVLNAQESEEPVLWDYPVKPGMPEWASFATGEQMREACQIPDKILEALSSKDLVKIILNYPLFFTFTIHENERAGVSFAIKTFNGLSELSKRKDGVFELINAYKEYPVLTQQPERSSKYYFAPFKLLWIELLLADDAFIKQLNEHESAELGKIVVEKYARKVESIHVYSLWDIKHTFLLCAVNILNYNINEKTPQQQETIKSFIENFMFADETLLTEMSKIISGL